MKLNHHHLDSLLDASVGNLHNQQPTNICNLATLVNIRIYETSFQKICLSNLIHDTFLFHIHDLKLANK